MIKYLYKLVLTLTVVFLAANISAQHNDNIIDQVIWVVGEESILKSDVEGAKQELQLGGQKFDGDPDCIIPEQIAVQKLFLHQAKIDSIDVPMSNVSRMVEVYLNEYISRAGSREKLEEYLNKPVNQIRDEMREVHRNRAITERVQDKIVGTIKLTPAEVRKFYADIPQDSLPYIPVTVEAEIISQEPNIPLTEIDAVKNRLREFTDRINKGETSFASLALLYSEDTGTAAKGGEVGFTGRSSLAPEYASAAFALTDPNKVSNIVETEYGFHIIQLIERRGDRINTRHILLKPKVPAVELNNAIARLDTVSTKLRENDYTVKDAIQSIAKDVIFTPEAATTKLSFEEAAYYISSDKETRNNGGLMLNNKNQYSTNVGTSRFSMEELPPEVAKIVDKMNVNDISTPFSMINDKGKQVVAIIKLKQRVDRHKANLLDDYQMIRTQVENQKKEEILGKWVQDKIKNTYVYINDGWKNCDFQYSGWVKQPEQ